MEATLAQAQAQLAGARAENTLLRSIVQVLLSEMPEEAFSRARGRLEALDAGEGAPDVLPGG